MVINWAFDFLVFFRTDNDLGTEHIVNGIVCIVRVIDCTVYGKNEVNLLLISKVLSIALSITMCNYFNSIIMKCNGIEIN